MIEWKKLWKEFNRWYEAEVNPDWSEQQAVKEGLVEKYIKKAKEKK